MRPAYDIAADRPPRRGKHGAGRRQRAVFRARPAPVARNISKNTLLAGVMIVWRGPGRGTDAGWQADPGSAAGGGTRSVSSVASFLDVLTSYERQARWGLAVVPPRPPCEHPRCASPIVRPWARNWWRSVVRRCSNSRQRPRTHGSAPVARRMPTSRHCQRSMEYPLPPPLQIAQSASDNRLFLLATVAYADAFKNGDSSAEDRASSGRTTWHSTTSASLVADGRMSRSARRDWPGSRRPAVSTSATSSAVRRRVTSCRYCWDHAAGRRLPWLIH